MLNIFSPSYLNMLYSKDLIETERCRVFIDRLQEQTMSNVIENNLSYDEWTFLDPSYLTAGVNSELVRPICDNFKNNFRYHLEHSMLNRLTRFDSFNRVDICLGCAQYIDNLHIKYDVQILEDEYNYHQKLNPNLIPKTIDTLEAGKHLIISMPFSSIGVTHPRMKELLDKCLELHIPIHIDGAWITAAKNINLDLSHPAIESFGVSLSKGYGLSGWNRIGLRWTRNVEEDSITIMNDSEQINMLSVVIGNYFLNKIPIDHLWNTHGNNHYKICNDFNLTPSDTIHMVTQANRVCGIAPLLRYLETNV